MTKLLLSISVFFLVSALAAQPFGNEWIDYDQKYYRFKIWEDGVYRITYQDLTAAGIPISLVNPEEIQIFGHASQIPIYIRGGEDGVFNSDDYIEFIAEANNGRHDAILYESNTAQGNPDYSLFNDTARYFFSLGSSVTSRRFVNVTDENIDNFTSSNYVWRRSAIVFSNRYYDQPSLLDTPPANDPNFRVALSEYNSGEGWLSSSFGFNTGTGLSLNKTVNIPIPNIYQGTDAPAAEVSTTVVGVSDIYMTGPDHFIQIRAGTDQMLKVNQQFDGYTVNRFEFSLSNNQLSGSETQITHTVVNSLGAFRDEQALAKTEVLYPHSLNLSGAFQLVFENKLNTEASKTRYDFLNIDGATPRIYTQAFEAERVELTMAQNAHQGLISNDISQDRFDCYLVTDQTIKGVSEIEIAGNNGFFTNFGQSQVDSAFVIITHESLLAPAQAYANFRQQDFNTVLVKVDELYDQFGFGIEKSGLSIRNFSNYILQTWTSTPQHLLLLGKSVRDATVGNLAGTRRNAINFERNLVPSLGYPPSDVYLTSGLANTFLDPALRTGRVSARNPEEVSWYLNKLQSFEAQPHALWMKNVMHFGGGTTLQEQQRFAMHLSNYETAIEDSSFGAKVYTYLKSGSDPIQINASEEIRTLIEDEGISLMTFFAHAGSEGFDQSIDDPSNFDWNGKHPFLLGNGCFSGDYHSPTRSSTSEKYTILEGKGVIGFLASVDQGIEGDLNYFSQEFYNKLSRENYGATIGHQIKKTIQEVQTGTILRKYLCYGMGLQGDPGIVLNSFPLPDLEVFEQDIYFLPENITADIDSFTVGVVVKNSARATNQSFNITVEHHTPEGIGDSTFVYEMNGLYYRDTALFRLPVDLQYGLGLHQFDVLVDLPDNILPELPGFETINNQVLDKDLFISNGGLVPVFPYRYDVVPQGDITLKASTGNPLAPSSSYTMQIDTTDLYNSPLLQTIDITQSGGVLEWQPSLSYADSSVYFWRCGQVSDGDIVWRESSFQYIPNTSGWGQSQFFQFKNNSYLSTEYNREERRVNFFNGSVTLSNKVLGGSAGFGNNIMLNFTEVEYGACFTTPSIHLAVFDPVTFQAWGTNAQGQNPNNDFGNANAGTGCRQRVEYYFIFRQTVPSQMQALADLLNSETIPDGHYVILYTLNNVRYSLWDAAPDIYDAFQDLGAQIIGSPMATDSVPFSLIARKGDAGFVYEVYGSSPAQIIQNTVELPASGTQGKIVSTKIGPATKWNSAHWRTYASDDGAGDDSQIRLLGISHTGVESPIVGGGFPANNTDVNLEDLISAEAFPYIVVEAIHKDTLQATPLQIDRWHVLYDQVPEAAIDAHTHFVFEAQKLQQGEKGLFSVAVRNISNQNMDSLLIKYWIVDPERNRIDLPYERQDSLRAGKVFIDTLYFDTHNLSGRNEFWMEVNPKNQNTGIYDQLEQNHFNNVVQVPFTVDRDAENPILDVTFDGIHIINGEIVSAKPEILIALKDENPFLLMDQPSDTALFKVYLQSPLGDLEQTFFHSNNDVGTMQFIPASSQKNRAKILFRPDLVSDGTYKLLVQARDKSGNQSGSLDYQIEFEVVNRSTISEVLNYPNPFSTSTQFVFTLTGSEIPDEFKIQIMTISGKVIREIMLQEFGPIRIGRNFSQYRWDGRDEFGDRLANGVYLYKVTARLHGETIDKRDNGASQFFTKSWGKMVLFK